MALGETLIEAPGRIEPCLLDEVEPAIVDLVAALSRASQALGARLHPRSAEGLAELVRVMTCCQRAPSGRGAARRRRCLRPAA